MFKSTKKITTAIFIVLISLVLLTGCGDTTGADSSLGKANFTMKVGGNTRNALTRAISMTDLGATSFNITEARVNIRHIEFELSDGDSSNDTDSLENTTKVTGPFIVDLITGIATPAIGEIELPVGIYERIDVRLDDVKSNSTIDSSDDLFENTFVVKGTCDYDTTAGRPFTIILKFNEDVRFESVNGINVSSVGVADILLTLNVSEWLEGVNITKALEDGDLLLENGNITIVDEDGNDEIESIIKTTIKNKYDLDD